MLMNTFLKMTAATSKPRLHDKYLTCTAMIVVTDCVLNSECLHNHVAIHPVNVFRAT